MIKLSTILERDFKLHFLGNINSNNKDDKLRLVIFGGDYINDNKFDDNGVNLNALTPEYSQKILDELKNNDYIINIEQESVNENFRCDSGIVDVRF